MKTAPKVASARAFDAKATAGRRRRWRSSPYRCTSTFNDWCMSAINDPWRPDRSGRRPKTTPALTSRHGSPEVRNDERRGTPARDQRTDDRGGGASARRRRPLGRDDQPHTPQQPQRDRLRPLVIAAAAKRRARQDASQGDPSGRAASVPPASNRRCKEERLPACLRNRKPSWVNTVRRDRASPQGMARERPDEPDPLSRPLNREEPSNPTRTP